MLPDSSAPSSKLPVSTARLALDDLQKKRSRFDEIQNGMQSQSIRKMNMGSYVQPAQQNPISPRGLVQSISQ